MTGSVGKTSVKDLLAAAFRQAGAAHCSERSYNNHWGAPLSLARMPRETERGVFELGMNHAGEIRTLSHLIKPHIAVITKIAPAHLEQLGSLEAIADAKAEIFEGLEDWGAAIIPGDDAFAERLGERAGAAGAGWLVRFGTDRQAEVRLDSFETDGDSAIGEAQVFGRRVAFRIGSASPHWGLNATAVLAAAYLADTPLDAAVEALAAFTPGEGRGAIESVPLSGGAFTLIDDSYNANPASMAAALAALGARAPGGGRRIACLGDMLELGADADAMHAALAADIEAAGVDLVYTVGEHMRALFDALAPSRQGGWAADAATIAPEIARMVGPGDAVLVKGSNGSRMANIVEALKTLAQ